MTNGTCSLPDCERPVKRRGYCYGHYMKAWRYGSPTPDLPPRYRQDIVGRRFGALVVTPAREGRHWVCRCDCGGTALATRDGLLSGLRVACGDRARHYRRPDAGYDAAHDRVRRDRGRATDYPCVDCQVPAAEWSYDHADEGEMVSSEAYSLGSPYSLDPAHYQPRCVLCHRRFDRAHNRSDGGRRGRAMQGQG